MLFKVKAAPRVLGYPQYQSLFIYVWKSTEFLNANLGLEKAKYGHVVLLLRTGITVGKEGFAPGVLTHKHGMIQLPTDTELTTWKFLI